MSTEEQLTLLARSLYWAMPVVLGLWVWALVVRWREFGYLYGVGGRLVAVYGVRSSEESPNEQQPKKRQRNRPQQKRNGWADLRNELRHGTTNYRQNKGHDFGGCVGAGK